MQYSVSVIIDGVIPIEVRIRTLLGRLLGGVRAASAYDGDTLGGWLYVGQLVLYQSATSAFNVSICPVEVLVRVYLFQFFYG